MDIGSERTAMQSIRLLAGITVMGLVGGAGWPLLSEAIHLGQSLQGLGVSESRAFDTARSRFLRVESPSSGLGPAYNGTSCAACHNQPVIGGVGTVSVLRAGFVHDGHYEIPSGGDLVQLFSIGNHACQPIIPASANNLAHRIPTPLFGAGLIEAISDSVIRVWEDPDDRNGDGIRGRAALVLDPATHSMRAGRFGWKAQQATLLSFTAEALRNEMGITSELFPSEIGTGVSAEQLASCDTVPDPEDRANPETHLLGVDELTFFLRFLAPVTPLGQNASIHRGLELFSRIDCGACHVPELRTGNNENPVLDHKAVNAYSDFLLHDIGTGDGAPSKVPRKETNSERLPYGACDSGSY